MGYKLRVVAGSQGTMQAGATVQEAVSKVKLHCQSAIVLVILSATKDLSYKKRLSTRGTVGGICRLPTV